VAQAKKGTLAGEQASRRRYKDILFLDDAVTAS
jgi:hypothetical protein